MMEVRPAVAADASAIAAVVQETHALHSAALPEIFQSPDAAVVVSTDIARLILDPRSVWLVVTAAERVIGYTHAEVHEIAASAYKRARSALHVVAMGITVSERRRGAGRALLAALRREAASRGLRELSLEVYSFNEAARTFYEEAGFIPLRTLLVAPVDGP